MRVCTVDTAWAQPVAVQSLGQATHNACRDSTVLCVPRSIKAFTMWNALWMTLNTGGYEHRRVSMTYSSKNISSVASSGSPSLYL